MKSRHTSPAPASQRLAGTRALPIGSRAWAEGREAAQRGDWLEAERCFRLATRHTPEDVLMWLNLAQACLRQEDSAGAAQALARALHLEPANTLGARMASEVFSRWLLSSLDLAGDLRKLPSHLLGDPKFLTQVAHSVWSAGKPLEAVTVAFQALAAKPAHVPAHELLVCCMRDLGMKAEAAECAKTVLALAPDHLSAKIHLLFDQRGACDWRDLDATLAEVVSAIAQLPSTAAQHIAPFGLLSMGIPSCLQRKAASMACRWMARQTEGLKLQPRGGRKPGLLRIGFLSADFRNHPVAQLVTEFIEALDRSRCSVHLYAHGLPDASDWRERLKTAADKFRDMGNEPDVVIARQIHEDEVDVLIELGGHTRGSRLGVLSYRPAPVQVSYLGYPGTTGHQDIDYVIGDATVTPVAAAEDYSEKIAQLPGCLIPGSRHRPPVQRMLRSRLGLPEKAFVMCALNQPYKLLPETFDVWCEVLRQVPRAVLWMTSPNEEVIVNLKQQAAVRGVAADRLVFAQRTSYVDYFSRFTAADIFVDTWPYGAHTTASDALWAGLPVLTVEGPAFASRVGSSLLRSVGLEELVCPDVSTYKQRLLHFARENTSLAPIREYLVSQRDQLALFDPQRFAAEFLTLVSAMHRRHVDGHAPDHLLVIRDPLPEVADESHSPAFRSPVVSGESSVSALCSMTSSSNAREPLRLHLGGKEVKQGWKVVNIQPAPGVDLLADIQDMSAFADASVDEIYASHVLEHVGQNAVLPTLKGLHRILVPGGQLRVSVPDLEVLCPIVVDAEAPLDKRYLAMRMMFGGQVDQHDFHYFGWTWDFMCSFLKSAGFSHVDRVQDFGLFRDASSLRPWGFPISLNVVATK